MNKDILILLAAWTITFFMLVFFIPKNKIREAIVIFMFKQVITWLIGLSVVELRLIEYPVELLFTYANRTSFSFEYFIYPSISAVFILNFPVRKSKVQQFMYYTYFCSIMTFLEVLCVKYTNIIKYIHWTWYVTWISLFLTFYISRQFYLWFFKIKQT
ncbi:MAG: hypothetical protein PHV56_00105 [Clostridia bacterium]|nr:hypothetical protein [Clostridia bacterium]